jgi:hypothetical protein
MVLTNILEHKWIIKLCFRVHVTLFLLNNFLLLELSRGSLVVSIVKLCNNKHHVRELLYNYHLPQVRAHIQSVLFHSNQIVVYRTDLISCPRARCHQSLYPKLCWTLTKKWEHDFSGGLYCDVAAHQPMLTLIHSSSTSDVHGLNDSDVVAH